MINDNNRCCENCYVPESTLPFTYGHTVITNRFGLKPLNILIKIDSFTKQIKLKSGFINRNPLMKGVRLNEIR